MCLANSFHLIVRYFEVGRVLRVRDAMTNSDGVVYFSPAIIGEEHVSIHPYAFCRSAYNVCTIVQKGQTQRFGLEFSSTSGFRQIVLEHRQPVHINVSWGRCMGDQPATYGIFKPINVAFDECKRTSYVSAPGKRRIFAIEQIPAID